jgi:hypothetical protein
MTKSAVSWFLMNDIAPWRQFRNLRCCIKMFYFQSLSTQDFPYVLTNVCSLWHYQIL